PQPRRRLELEAQRLDAVARLVAVEREAEFGRAGLDPLEMQLEPRHAGIGIEAHGLDQVMAPRRAAREAALDQALAPLGHAVAVGDDRPADPEHDAMPFVLARGQANRANRDVECRIAAPIDPADRPAI